MPNDESYLDSLLSGLTKDKGSSNDDRFAAYKKKATPEETVSYSDDTMEIYEEPETEGKRAEDDFMPELHEIPELNEAALSQKAAGEINNYSIFSDYDDEVIDEMINEELSGAKASGERFVMPENNFDASEDTNSNGDFMSGVDVFSTTDMEKLLASEVAGIEAEDGTSYSIFDDEQDYVIDEELDKANGTFIPSNQRDEIVEEPNLVAAEENKPELESTDYSVLEELLDFSSDESDLPKAEEPATDIFENDDLFSVNEEEAAEVISNEETEAAPDFSFDTPEETIGSENTDSSLDSLLDGLMDGTSEAESSIDELLDFGNTESNEAEEDISGDSDGDDTFDFLNMGGIQESEEDRFEPSPEQVDSANLFGNDDDSDEPLAGFSFNEEDSETPSYEEEPVFLEDDNGDAAGLFGELGVENLDEDDITDLENLFEELDIPDDEEPELEEVDTKKKKKKVKDTRPWYIKLFENVKIPEDKVKKEPTEEELAAAKAAAAEAKKAAADAKKAEKDEKKKAADEAKAAKARQTAEEKEAARKKRLETAEKLILEEADNTKKLNKWGVLVIFAFFLGLTALGLGLGSTIHYNITLRQASDLFDDALKYQDYDYYRQAYDKIYGLEIEEEDQELYDKIETVNFVSVRLTNYNNHISMNKYADGLDDLFNGLMMFRKWFAYASVLGAQDDMYFVRSVIYRILYDTYGITEEEAMSMLTMYDSLYETVGKDAARFYYTGYIYSTLERLGITE